jgi:hypothetical protein
VSRRRAQALRVVYVLVDEAIATVDMEAGFPKFGHLHFAHIPIRGSESSAKKAQRKVGPFLKYSSSLTEDGLLVIHFSLRHPFVLVLHFLEFDLLFRRKHGIDLVMEGLVNGIHLIPLLLL